MPWKENHKEKHAAYMREWRKAHPHSHEQREKDICRSYAKVYLKRGRLARRPCVMCDARAEMHHPDYTRPLLVVWLCREHHLSLHRLFHVEPFVAEDCEMDAFVWTGKAMVPARLRNTTKFVEGRTYWLDEVSDRSWISHRHEFAWIKSAWDSLPEALMETFPSPEHLRKAALIATGWRRETIIDAGNAKAALRVAAYARGEDEFAHVVARGSTVVVQKARSQRMHGLDRMDKTEFQASKDAILGWISSLIGVEPERLRGAA